MVQKGRIGRCVLGAGLGLAGLVAFGPAALAVQPATATVQPSSGAAPGAVRVSMKDFLFAPATLTIHAGQAVTWTYDESASDLTPNCETVALQIPGSPVTCPGHSTTANAVGPNGKPLWDSGVHRAAGFPYSVRFTTPGTYAYHCTVHGGAHPNNPVTHMNGTIVVLPAAAAPATPAPSPPPASAGGAPSSPAGSASPAAPATLPKTGDLPERRWAFAALVLAGATAVLRRVTARPDEVRMAHPGEVRRR
jgi:plastocyanin